MSNENIRAMIDALADKDYSVAATEFQSALDVKMNDAMNDRRIEIASSVYNNVSEDDGEVEDSASDSEE